MSEIGNYTIYELIGHGAYANVYHGVHKQTKQDVAVKVINLMMIPDEDEVCVAREVAALLQVDHPNIVFTYDFYVDDSYLYIFSEYISGNMMLDKVNGMHGLNEKLSRKYFNDILSAVCYLHKSRLVVHRDIKLQNILVSKNGCAKLIDFGFCNSLCFMKTCNSFVGTPGYTAPEIIDSSNYDYKCDIFSLGVCLYAMIVGKTPFNLQNTDSKLLREQIDEIKFPDEISPLAVDLMRRMLESNPSKRITLDEIIAHPWVRMESFHPERYEYRRNPLDLGGVTTIELLSQIKRKSDLIVCKNAVRFLSAQGMDGKKIICDVKRGRISPESGAYLIVMKNNLVKEEDLHESAPEHVRKPTINVCANTPVTETPHLPLKERAKRQTKLPSLKVPRPAGNGPYTVPRLPTPTGFYSKRFRL